MKNRTSPWWLLGILSLFSLGTVILAPFWGAESIDPWNAWREWLSQPKEQWSSDAQILAVRLPRIALAWLAGGSLAMSGAVMQTLLRNGLATPFTLGVSSAGSFGAFLFIAFPTLTAYTGGFGLRLGSLTFALAEIALVLAVAKRSTRAEGLILAGITFNFLFGAGTMMIRYLADPYRLASMERWLMGSLDTVTWETPLSLLPWLGGGLILVFWRLPALDFLAFDEELAASRGVAVASARRDLLIGAGILTASVVAHSGPIGFLGLLIPHAVRPFTGMNHNLLLPACWISGGGFLVLADLFARSLQWSGRASEMPVGIMTAFLGAPFFLWLLIRGRT